MLRIFRNLRQESLTRKNIGRYLLYALGEILLVVIGILIALEINNRNQDRIDADTEQIYLSGLKEEFETSKSKLAELISVNQQNYSGAIQILKNIKNPNLSEEKLSTLLYQTFSYDVAFNPNNSLLNEMISSGKLKTLQNTELRKMLTNWLSTLEDISRQEIALEKERNSVLDHLRTDSYSLHTLLDHSGVSTELGLPSTPTALSNMKLFQSTAFENNVLMFVLTTRGTEQAHYLPLMADIERILDLIDKELD